MAAPERSGAFLLSVPGVDMAYLQSIADELALTICIPKDSLAFANLISLLVGNIFLSESI